MTDCENCRAIKAVGEDFLCMRCYGRANGLKCASCGSPWLYIRAHGSHYEDGEERLLCKPCTYTLMNDKGLG